jgi:ATP-dependent RNA helicase DDX56/DBP9
MQTNSGHDGNIKPLPMQMSDVERFRYRVDDVSSGLTKKAVNEYRARELQMEVLNSEKLQEYFEEHPEEKAALQRAQRQLKEKKSIRRNLQTVPFYLVPEGFTAANPVQQAVRDEVAASGGKISKAARKSRFLDAKRKDPLQAFQALPTVGRKGRKKFTREQFAHIDRRLDPKVTNVESLPPLSGRKLWKLNKGKRLRPKGVVAGDRKRMTPKQKQLKKKFGGR